MKSFNLEMGCFLKILLDFGSNMINRNIIGYIIIFILLGFVLWYNCNGFGRTFFYTSISKKKKFNLIF